MNRAWIATLALVAGCSLAPGSVRPAPDGAPLTASQYRGAREAACWTFIDTVAPYADQMAGLQTQPSAAQLAVLETLVDAYRDFRDRAWALVPPPEIADAHAEMDRLLGQMIDLLDAAVAATSDYDSARTSFSDRFPNLVAAYDVPAKQAGLSRDCGW